MHVFLQEHLRLAFRKKAAAVAGCEGVEVRSKVSETWANGMQRTYELLYREDLDAYGVRETEGYVRDFPRALRAKRGVPGQEGDIHIEHDYNYGEAAAVDNEAARDHEERPARRRRRALEEPAVQLTEAEQRAADINIWQGRTRMSTAPDAQAIPMRRVKRAGKAATGRKPANRSSADRKGKKAVRDVPLAHGPVDAPAAPVEIVVKGEIDSVNDLFNNIEIASTIGSGQSYFHSSKNTKLNLSSDSTQVYSRHSSVDTVTGNGDEIRLEGVVAAV